MAPGSLWKDVNLEGSENIEAMDLMSNERIETTAEEKFQLGSCRNAWLKWRGGPKFSTALEPCS